MKSKERMKMKAALKVALAITIGWMCWSGGNTSHAQTPPANLSPGLQEVLKLSKAQVGDEVIIGYVNNSGTAFPLTSDEILYLKDQGVSQPVIAALLRAKAAAPPPTVSPEPPTAPQPVPAPSANPAPVPAPQPPPTVVAQQPAPLPEAPPPPAPPAPEINFQYFHDQLAPFGTWVNIGGVMYWQPDRVIAANPDWRPYYDMGHWVETENGLFWQSDYMWGDIPFHYGRWVLMPGRGWLWVPDYTWGPAWVFWRHAEVDGMIGWAPLPVGAVFVEGVFWFNGVRVGLDFNFGLGEACFTFVDHAHFHEGFFRMRGHEWGYHIGRERLHAFYGRSVVRNEFRRDEHGRFVNNGIGRERLEHATRGRIEHSNFVERHPVGDRAKLAYNKPLGGSAGGMGGGLGGKTGGGAGGKASEGSHEYAKTPYRPPMTSTATSGGMSGHTGSSGGTSGHASSASGKKK